jgi:hypothetical protein
VPPQGERIATLEARMNGINDALVRIEGKVDKLESHHHSTGEASTNGKKARALKRGGMVGSVGVGGYALLEVLRALLGI